MGAVFGKKTVVPAMQKAAKEIEPKDIAPVAVATLDERAAAASKRARRGGRRALLSAGRLGGGEGEQTTLGAG
jgi:hypothetical protein